MNFELKDEETITLEQIANNIVNGEWNGENKIHCIKMFRTVCKIGLRESKDYIDAAITTSKQRSLSELHEMVVTLVAIETVRRNSLCGHGSSDADADAAILFTVSPEYSLLRKIIDNEYLLK